MAQWHSSRKLVTKHILAFNAASQDCCKEEQPDEAFLLDYINGAAGLERLKSSSRFRFDVCFRPGARFAEEAA